MARCLQSNYRELHASSPKSRVVDLKGKEHEAMDTASELLANVDHLSLVKQGDSVLL